MTINPTLDAYDRSRLSEQPATQRNLDEFCELLTDQYEHLFANDPDYAYTAQRTSAWELARKMTLGLDCGNASKDGKAIVAVCRQLGISHTYKAIRAHLSAE